MLNSTRPRAFACALVFAATTGVVAVMWLQPLAAAGFSITIAVLSAIIAELLYRLEQTTKRFELATVTDANTGVLTSPAFFAAGESAPDAISVTITVEDIEALYEEYGHTTAEEVLAHVANVIAASVRESDIIGKTGNDCFGVLLQEVEREVAQRICARIEFKVADTPYSNGQSIIELSAHAAIDSRPLVPSFAAA